MNMNGGGEVAPAVLMFAIVGWAFGCIGVRHCRRSVGRWVQLLLFFVTFTWRAPDVFGKKNTLHFNMNVLREFLLITIPSSNSYNL